MKFNVVYSDLHESYTDVFNGHEFIFTREPMERADTYLYLNVTSAGKRPQRTRVPECLILEEPEVVLPWQYDPKAWKSFDRVYSCHSEVPDSVYIYTWRGTWERDNIITQDQGERERKYPLANRKDAIVMIAGNKTSPVDSQIYSLRGDAARWWYEKGRTPFEAYGTPAFNTPNYRGPVAPGPGPRIRKFAEYRYAFCTENTDHPVWSRGYHQKIPDCLEARTVPIYYGCADIEKYVPKECFIDFREFDKSFEKVDEYLCSITEEEYLAKIAAIDKFVCSGALGKWSWKDLYEKVSRIYIDDDMEKNGEVAAIQMFVKPGDVVFDVGARTGDWSKHLPKAVDLYSFEPDEKVFKTLNTPKKYCIALSDHNGVSSFYMNSLSLYDLVTNRKDDVVQVECMTIDNFCADNGVGEIDYLKIDTEGSEFDVLKGARRMLEQGRIGTVQFEYGETYWHAGVTLQEVAKYLEDFGYGIQKLTEDGPKDLQVLQEDYHYSNYIARRTQMERKKAPVTGIIFSKNRAMQLDACLRSFKANCGDPWNVDLTVLFTTTDKLHATQYAGMLAEYPDVAWVMQRDFSQDVQRLTEGYEHVLFITDDTIFTNQFFLDDITRGLLLKDVIGFSLRLGGNTTFCYMQDNRFQEIPEFRGSIIYGCKFDWTKADGDFGYPLELSSSLYRLDVIRHLLDDVDVYNSPNTLEAWLDYSKGQFEKTRPILQCFEHSVAFAAPVNLVQTNFTGNRHGANPNLTVEHLSLLYEKGYRIDLQPFEFSLPQAVHQEVIFTFLDENGKAYKEEAEPEVSILMLNYNGLADVRRAITSLRRTLPGVLAQIVVWDNASTDGSREYLEQQSDIALIKSDVNIGVEARERILPLAKAKYIVMCDNDIVFTSGWFQDCRMWAEQIPDLGIIGPRTNYASGFQPVDVPVTYDGPEDFDGIDRFAQQWSSQTRNKGQFMQTARLPSFFWFVKREVVERIGNLRSFGIWGYEDDDYSLRCHLSGLRVLINNGLFFHHSGGPQGRGNQEYNRLMLEAWERFKEAWNIPQDWKYGEHDHVTYTLSTTTFNKSLHYIPLQKDGDNNGKGIEGKFEGKQQLHLCETGEDERGSLRQAWQR